MAAILGHNFGGGMMTSVDKFKLSVDLNCVLKKDLSWNQRANLEKLGVYSTGNDNIILDDGFDESVLGQLRKELKNVVDEGKRDIDDDHAEKRALRAAILKTRFAETIAKANAGKSDSKNAHQETQRLKRRRLEEAKIKASVRKEQLKQEELKRQRNKEREAARKALELVERNVEVEDNFKVMKEFEMLIKCSVCYSDRGYGPERR